MSMPIQRIDIPDVIPGLDPEENPTLFAEWLDSRSDIFYRGLLADKVLKGENLQCKFIYAAWLFNSLDHKQKPMIRTALSSIHLAQIFWDNLHLSDDIPFVKKIIENAGGLLSFIINIHTHRDFDEFKTRAIYLKKYLTNRDIATAHNLEYNFSKDSVDFFEILPTVLQISILKNSKASERLYGYKIIALKYLNEEIHLDASVIDLLVKEINSPNFTNLIRDKLFIPFCSFRNRINGVTDPFFFLFHPEKDMFSLLGIKNKRLKKEFYTKGKGKEINLNVIGLFSKIEDVQKQEELVKIVENFSEEQIPLFFDEMFDRLVIKGILKDTKDEIAFSYQCMTLDKILVNDTIFMIRKMHERYRLSLTYEREFIEEFKDKKIDLKKMHDWLSKKVKTGNSVALNQDKIQSLDGKKIEDLIIVVPKDNTEFVAVGSHLSICVGNGSYLDKVLTRKSMIFFLKRDEDVKYCVEISYNFNILQAKGNRNIPMSDVTLRKLNTLIKSELLGIKSFSLLKYIKSIFIGDTLD